MQNKEDQWESLYLFAKELSDHNTNFNEIENQLLKKTDNKDLIIEILQQLKKVRYAVHRKNGLAKIAFGSLLLLIGFLITCINFHSNQSFDIVMYSTSTVGLCLIFWGLYQIIG